MWRIFAQTETTTTTAAAGGDAGPFKDADAKFLAPIQDGLWWIIEHRLIFIALGIAIIIGVVGYLTGNQNRAVQSRKMFGGIVGTFVLAALAAMAIAWVRSKS
jgi:hypothetical protein